MKAIETLKRIVSVIYKTYSKIEDKVFDIIFRELFGIDPNTTIMNSGE